MHIVCLDLEGVLVPEIWINVSLKTGIKELMLTTRDEPDYDVLMKHKIQVTLRKEQGHDINAACGQLRSQHLK